MRSLPATESHGHEWVDYHCHLLPGIDDGARDLDEALAMARHLADAGCVVVHCTPHCISGLYENDAETVRTAVSELQIALDNAGIPLQLQPGMEYYLDEFFPQALRDPLPLGTSSFLLVEAPPNASRELLEESIFLAVRQGLTPLLAHPERLPLLVHGLQRGLLARLFSANRKADKGEGDAPLIERLRRLGCRFQGNLGSFSGAYGHRVRKQAMGLLRAGQYDCFGSDGHRLQMLQNALRYGLPLTRRHAHDSLGRMS